MNDKFLEVMEHEGPVTIVGYRTCPSPVVSTWMSYIEVNISQKLMYIPAAGMHSIEKNISKEPDLLVTVGSKDVQGIQGSGAGFYVYGKGKFLDAGSSYNSLKNKFPWLRKVLQIKIEKIDQKI